MLFKSLHAATVCCSSYSYNRRDRSIHIQPGLDKMMTRHNYIMDLTDVQSYKNIICCSFKTLTLCLQLTLNSFKKYKVNTIFW
jgi:hypothetical protein